jgi:hypothetical protein
MELGMPSKCDAEEFADKIACPSKCLGRTSKWTTSADKTVDGDDARRHRRRDHHLSPPQHLRATGDTNAYITNAYIGDKLITTNPNDTHDD